MPGLSIIVHSYSYLSEQRHFSSVCRKTLENMMSKHDRKIKELQQHEKELVNQIKTRYLFYVMHLNVS